MPKYKKLFCQSLKTIGSYTWVLYRIKLERCVISGLPVTLLPEYQSVSGGTSRLVKNN